MIIRPESSRWRGVGDGETDAPVKPPRWHVGKLYNGPEVGHFIGMIMNPKKQPGWMLAVLMAVAFFCRAPIHAATYLVGIYDYDFDPMLLQIGVGDTVTWHNYGQTNHSVVSKPPAQVLNSGVLQTNQEYSFTFTSLGIFNYTDPLYFFLDMKGSILVSPPNQPPTVSITNPAAGANFAGPVNMLIEATASDSDGTVARVEFFVNTSSIGAITNPPYRVVANNLTAGIYALSAVATDNSSASSTSSVVSVSVWPVLRNPIRTASNQFQVTLTGVTPGKTNILYTSTNLQTWTPILTNRPSSTETNLVDTAATNQARFYRVTQL